MENFRVAIKNRNKEFSTIIPPPGGGITQPSQD